MTNSLASELGCTPRALCVPIKVGPAAPTKAKKSQHGRFRQKSHPVEQWSPRLTDVQRVSGLARDPTGIEEDELLNQLGQLFTVKRGQCDPGGGLPRDEIRVVPNVSFPGQVSCERLVSGNRPCSSGACSYPVGRAG